MQKNIFLDAPIGVFDSGVGGLTVLKSLREYLPNEQFIYLGDTARLPYGTKSPETILNYTVRACKELVARGVKALVIACNTASTVSIPVLKENFPNLPILGVIEPGASAALTVAKKSINPRIAVLATEATVSSKAYELAILRQNPQAEVISVPCGLFVALAEEGWTNGEIAEKIAEKYLASLMQSHLDNPIDCLVLGCTHFPVLIDPIRKITHSEITIVDSAHTAASEMRNMLIAEKLIQSENHTNNHLPTFLVTDGPSRFVRVAKSFLGVELDEKEIELMNF